MTTTRHTAWPPNVDRALLSELESRVPVAPGRPMMDVVAPFTGEVIGHVPQAAPDDVVTAVAAARAAQREWAKIPVKERARVILRFHDLLIEKADQALDLLQLDGGKARVPAFEEVYDVIATARYYARTGPKLLRRRRRRVSLPLLTTTWEYRHPVGVVGNITPWNFPFTLSISDILPALIAGNSVVIKPDEITPYPALLGDKLLEESGLPPDVLQVVTGRGEEIGPALIDAVDYIAFTGSTEVGRLVAEQAGRRLIGTSLELGGKNAAIVMADTDLEKHIPEIARSIVANGGQLCISVERLLVDRRIHAEFTKRLVEHVRGLELTTEYRYGSGMSSKISPRHLARVHEHVEDAVEKGANLLTGGKPRPDVGPMFYEPTVLTDVTPDMALFNAETFGAVVAIYPFDTIDEAVQMANDSGYGLNFSVWTKDPGVGVRVASQLQAGTVGVNDGYAATWSSYDAPLGGMKDSGLSRRHGEVGILKFTEAQTISVQRLVPAFAPFPGMSYQRYQRLLGPMLKVLKRLPFYK